MVNTFTAKELDDVYITRKELGQRRKLGDYLLRIAYHESVHAGQLLTIYAQPKSAAPKYGIDLTGNTYFLS